MEKFNKEFKDTIIEYSQLISEGESKKANKLHNKLHQLYLSIKKGNKVHIFHENMIDENENIRLWASIFSLKSSESRAIQELKNLSTLDNITGITAKMSLKLWLNGELNLL